MKLVDRCERKCFLVTERATQYAAVGMIVYILVLRFDYISILLEDTTGRLRQRSDRPCCCYIITSIQLWPVLEGLPRPRPPPPHTYFSYHLNSIVAHFGGPVTSPSTPPPLLIFDIVKH